jgi:nuclear GTP-binding protein
VREILRICPQEKMMSIYKIPSFESTEGFLHHLAQVRGKLKKGGALDLIATAKLVLKDWNEGGNTILIFYRSFFL